MHQQGRWESLVDKGVTLETHLWPNLKVLLESLWINCCPFSRIFTIAFQKNCKFSFLFEKPNWFISMNKLIIVNILEYIEGDYLYHKIMKKLKLECHGIFLSNKFEWTKLLAIKFILRSCVILILWESNLTYNLEVLVVFNGVDEHFPQNNFYNYFENWT